MMRKTKTILLFFSIFLSCFCLLMPIESVLSSPVNYIIEDWDSYNLGVTSGSNAYVTWERTIGSAFYIIDENSYKIVDDKCLFIDDNDAGWINLTSPPSYISRIDIYMYWNSAIAPGTFSFLFYNSSHSVIMRLELYDESAPSTYLQIKDANNATQIVWDIGGDNSDTENMIFRMTHIIGNEMRYQCINATNNNIYGTVNSSINSVTDWSSFSFLYLDGISGVNALYIDDIIITEDSPPDGDGYTPPDPDLFQIGQIRDDLNVYSGYPSKYIEHKYTVPFNGTVLIYDLLVHRFHFDRAWELTNYNLEINGVNIGNPSNIFPYSGFWYIIRWANINREFDANSLLFEIRNTKIIAGATYWHVGLSGGIDVDNDFYIIHKYHNVDSLYGNNNYDGTLVENQDIVYALYYDVDIPYPDYAGENWVGLSGSQRQYEPQMISYTISELGSAYDNYITIYHETYGQVTNQSFPQKITLDASSSLGWIPYYYGDYTINLLQNNVNVSSDTITITENPSSFVIWTEPSKVYKGRSYEIHYKYIHTENKHGAIFIGDDSFFGNNDNIHTITTNGLSSFTYTDTSYSPIYISLCVNHTSIRYSQVDQYILYVISPIQDVYLYVTQKPMYISSEYTRYQTIIGQHSQLLATVHIFLNDQFLADVSNEVGEFLLQAPITQSGFYNVSMKLVTTNGTKLLAFDTFTAGLPSDDPSLSILPDIPDVFKAILGTIITTVFLLLPMLISFSFKKSANDIPSIVFAISGGLGIVLSVGFGFFGVWVPFFITVIGIIVVVLMYIQKM